MQKVEKCIYELLNWKPGVHLSTWQVPERILRYTNGHGFGSDFQDRSEFLRFLPAGDQAQPAPARRAPAVPPRVRVSDCGTTCGSALVLGCQAA